MAFDVRPCELSDMCDMATIHHDAFADDQIVGHLMADVPREIKIARDTEAFEKTFREQHLNGSRHYKAVELETGYVEKILTRGKTQILSS